MDEEANATPSPAEQVSRLYEDLEARGARASEELVAGSGFTALLARAAENAAALTKISSDTMDIVLRNLRVAGRRDVVSLARQLARTEDKLERVLQEVEELRDELKRAAAATPSDRSEKASRAPRTQSARSDGRTAGRAPARKRKDPS